MGSNSKLATLAKAHRSVRLTWGRWVGLEVYRGNVSRWRSAHHRRRCCCHLRHPQTTPV